MFLICATFFSIIILCVISWAIYQEVKSSRKERNEKRKEEECKVAWNEKIIKLYNEWIEENHINIPENAIKVKNYCMLTNKFSPLSAFIWIENSDICICTSSEGLNTGWKLSYTKLMEQDINRFDLPREKININNVKFYKVEGDLISNTEISGGEISGGGSSISGTVIGGFLAGSTGAIIGSRKKIKSSPIQSKIVYDDNRKINLYIDNDGKIEVRQYSYDFLNPFQKFMPGKYYDYLVLQKSIL